MNTSKPPAEDSPGRSSPGAADDEHLSVRVDGDAASIVPGRSAELAGPHLLAGGVIAANERVEASRRRLPRKDRCRRTNNRETAAWLHGDTGGDIGAAATELAGPQRRAGGVVLSDEGIPAARRPLLGKGALRLSNHICATQAIDCCSPGDIAVPSAELTRPDLLSGSVVLAEEGVERAARCLAWQGAEGLACDVDSTRFVNRDGLGFVEVLGAELANPTVIVGGGRRARHTGQGHAGGHGQ